VKKEEKKRKPIVGGERVSAVSPDHTYGVTQKFKILGNKQPKTLSLWVGYGVVSPSGLTECWSY